MARREVFGLFDMETEMTSTASSPDPEVDTVNGHGPIDPHEGYHADPRPHRHTTDPVIERITDRINRYPSGPQREAHEPLRGPPLRTSDIGPSASQTHRVLGSTLGSTPTSLTADPTDATKSYDLHIRKVKAQLTTMELLIQNERNPARSDAEELAANQVHGHAIQGTNHHARDPGGTPALPERHRPGP